MIPEYKDIDDSDKHKNLKRLVRSIVMEQETPTLVHLNVDGTAVEAEEVANSLNGKLPGYEFIVTNDDIESSFYNEEQMVEEIAERVVEKLEE